MLYTTHPRKVYLMRVSIKKVQDYIATVEVDLLCMASIPRESLAVQFVSPSQTVAGCETAHRCPGREDSPRQKVSQAIENIICTQSFTTCITYIFSLLQSMNQILNTVQTSLIPSSQLLVQKSTTASDGMRVWEQG